MVGTPTKPITKAFKDGSHPIWQTPSSQNFSRNPPNLHRVRRDWPSRRASPGVFYAFNPHTNPVDIAHDSSPLMTKRQWQEEAAVGPGVPVCLPFHPCYAGPMLPNPRAFLFFDSKQQVVNSSLFPSAQVKNSLYKLKRKRKNHKTGKFPENKTSLSSVTWFKIKLKTELLFPKELLRKCTFCLPGLTCACSSVTLILPFSQWMHVLTFAWLIPWISRADSAHSWIQGTWPYIPTKAAPVDLKHPKGHLMIVGTAARPSLVSP